jgi:anti-sigma B factor antagonist
MELKTYSSLDGAVTILQIIGRCDAYKVTVLKEWIQNKNGDTKQIVVNLTHTTYIDSAGLAALVQLMKQCHQQQGNLHICELQPPIRTIFELTRLDRAFAIFDKEVEAVAAFNH